LAAFTFRRCALPATTCRAPASTVGLELFHVVSLLQQTHTWPRSDRNSGGRSRVAGSKSARVSRRNSDGSHAPPFQPYEAPAVDCSWVVVLRLILRSQLVLASHCQHHAAIDARASSEPVKKSSNSMHGQRSRAVARRGLSPTSPAKRHSFPNSAIAVSRLGPGKRAWPSAMETACAAGTIETRYPTRRCCF
jgi:hypothetical protein